MRTPILLLAVLLTACDVSIPAPEVPDAAVAPLDPPPASFFRIDTLMTYPEAEAACTARGAVIANAVTIAELQEVFLTCLAEPAPGPYPAPTCWTGTWLDNGRITNVFVVDAPGYFKPVSAASLDSWLFFPLCEIRPIPEVTP